MIKWFLIKCIHFYKRYISIFTPPSCRFHPTCSSYMLGAIELHGVMLGLMYGTGRILRCHPFHPGGHDPIPPKRSS